MRKIKLARKVTPRVAQLQKDLGWLRQGQQQTHDTASQPSQAIGTASQNAADPVAPQPENKENVNLNIRRTSVSMQGAAVYVLSSCNAPLYAMLCHAMPCHAVSYVVCSTTLFCLTVSRRPSPRSFKAVGAMVMQAGALRRYVTYVCVPVYVSCVSLLMCV